MAGLMQLQSTSFSGTSLSSASRQLRSPARAPMQIQAAQMLQGKVQNNLHGRYIIWGKTW